MASTAPGHFRIKGPMLFICDPTGKVEAVTSKAAGETFSGRIFLQESLSEVLGLPSELTVWIQKRITEALNKDEYSAETSVDNGNGKLSIKLDVLKHDGELYGFALQIVPMMQDGAAAVLRDGDSVVERKQWHEIKNHIGALKLYATFLKKKMSEGDERRIVEKIFDGVNDLIGYMDRIRRGNAQ